MKKPLNLLSILLVLICLTNKASSQTTCHYTCNTCSGTEYYQCLTCPTNRGSSGEFVPVAGMCYCTN